MGNWVNIFSLHSCDHETDAAAVGSSSNAQVSALLASPFLLFANALSPITPRAASLADGSEPASSRMGRRGSAFESRSPGRLVFNSPDRCVASRSSSAGEMRSARPPLASVFAPRSRRLRAIVASGRTSRVIRILVFGSMYIWCIRI